ncbi:class Ib ribonucleoside-diphosphate reductase assembly flavoprotein NrdI [Streptococcus infantis]
MDVVGSGNRNFNNQYCVDRQKRYSSAFGFPVID